MRVPGFLVRQLYVAGSLRNVSGGFSLQARNSLGDGWLDAIGAIRVDGQQIPLDDISATREGDPIVYRALDVTPETPVVFRRGDVVTFWIAGWALDPGDHQLEVDLHEHQLGALSLGFTERLHDDAPV
ncbi:MAG: hypothetical protein LH650_16055 [Chloroflexi bacterium]|nr:hypothetical protein [Chloroflexota bacterium]